MDAEGLKVQGEGTADDKVYLPSTPDDAVEYDVTSRAPMDPLEALISDNVKSVENLVEDTLNEFVGSPDNLASPIQQNIVIDQAVIEKAVTDIINPDKIVTDPTPTPAKDLEFDINKSSNALDDFDEEGGVRKVRSPGAPAVDLNKEVYESIKSEQIVLGSKKSDFNPGTIQNALLDSDREGGIVTNKSASNMKSNGDAASEGKQFAAGTTQENTDNDNKYRVYGFDVQYTEKSGSEQPKTITKSISDFFIELSSAMILVNGSKYMLPVDNDSFKMVDIVSGKPTISLGDRQLYQYGNGMWKKL